MIDPIGAPSGVLALAIFVFNAGIALKQALKDIRSCPSEIAELNAELDDVLQVLGFLRKAASHNVNDLLELEPLLSHCGGACQEFLKLITKCSTERKGKRAMFITWAKLQVSKADIMRVRSILNQVKSTTSLKLGSINMERFAVTAAALDEYQRLVKKNIVETQQNLRQINSQLASLSGRHCHTDEDFERWQHLQADKSRCENDLRAFSEVLAHLKKVELDKLDTILHDPDTNQAVRTTLERPIKERLTVANIQEFMEKVPQAIFGLKSHLSSIEEKLSPFSTVDMEARQTLQADKQADEHHLDILRKCNYKAEQKRPNVFKNIRAAEAANQAIISNVGELFDCENIRAGPRAGQLFGQCSDESIQRFWSRENTTASSEGRLYQNDILQKSEWFVWHFVALCAGSGAVAWIVNRGLT